MPLSKQPVDVASDTDLFAGYCYGVWLLKSTLAKGLSAKLCGAAADKECEEAKAVTKIAQQLFDETNKYFKARRFFDENYKSPASKAAEAEITKGSLDVATCIGLGAPNAPKADACARVKKCEDTLILRLDTEPDSVVKSKPQPLPSEKRL